MLILKPQTCKPPVFINNPHSTIRIPQSKGPHSAIARLLSKTMETMYSQTIAKHIANPRNVGEIADASGRGDVTNLACMDRILLTIKIEEDRVVDAKVKAHGCPPTIAAASVLTQLILNRSVTEADSLTRKDVETALERLPATKMHCAVLAIDALREALEDYRIRSRSEGRK